ncbi:cupin domain-containing protein [Saccharothrix sp. S26]|uniref:cupin domain-containing protein n=1 Tax=Saccharothrix sp. S26 TaxID=2907215 RepID=UPI001F39D0C5|nr:cupin domain-containing protein [Saccharothrix sp. S26]MCE6997192.1 cupin domain-containing protein [Saccharothrix sp. S26]
MSAPTHRVMSLDDVVANRRRGGALRILLSPVTTGSTAGFLGVATVEPGEQVDEHYHPYSEEFLFVVEGSITLDLDDVPHALTRDQAVLVPIGTRHRLRNTGSTTARVLFQLSPLAPAPELGHVDTETGGTRHVRVEGAR